MKLAHSRGGRLPGMDSTHARLGDYTQMLERDRRADAAIGWALATDLWITDVDQPLKAFRSRGFSRYVPTSTKDVAQTTADLGDSLRASLGIAIEQTSAVGALVEAGATQIPVAAVSMGRALINPIVATTVAEGDAKPIATLGVSFAGPPTKTVAQVVTSKEFARSLDAATHTAIRRSLVSAAASGVNTILLGAFTSAAASSATTVGGLLAALDHVGAPVVIGGYAELAPMAADLAGLAKLGVTIIPMKAAAGTLVVVDAGGVVLGVSAPIVDTAHHADVAGLGSPESSISLWSQNAMAVRAEQFVQVGVRTGAVVWNGGS
jgi:hypothetical protein